MGWDYEVRLGLGGIDPSPLSPLSTQATFSPHINYSGTRVCDGDDDDYPDSHDDDDDCEGFYDDGGYDEDDIRVDEGPAGLRKLYDMIS